MGRGIEVFDKFVACWFGVQRTLKFLKLEKQIQCPGYGRG
jgi:hypothetical protein